MLFVRKNRFHAEAGHRKSALNPVRSATGVQGGSLCGPGIRRGASMAFPACCCQRHILADASANTCLPSPPLEITVARLCPGCFRFEGTAGVRMQDRSAEKIIFRSLPSPRCRRINRCRHQTAGNTGRMQAYRKKGQGGNNNDEDYGTERAADDRRARAEAE